MKKAKKIQMQQLFQLSAQVAQLQPWLHFEDTQLICIKHPELEENAYVNILGNAKQTYGLVLYLSEENLTFYDLTSQSDILNLPADYIAASQNALALYFDVDKYLPDINLEQLEKYYPNYPSDFAPQYLSYKATYMPWILDQTDAAHFIQVLTLFLEAYPHINLNKAKDKDLTTCEYQKDKWKISYLEEDNHEIPIQVAEVEVDTPISLKHLEEEWELDFRSLPFAIGESKLGRPTLGAIASVIEVESGFAYQPAFLRENMPVQQVFVDAILSNLYQVGIPKVVYVRSPVYRWILEEIAQKFDFEIEIKDDLKNSDIFFDHMIDILSIPEDMDFLN